MKTIINADDLGLSPEVNGAIFQLMAEQRISSATLLVNGTAARAAVRTANQFPGCSFGVHLNLTEFRPLSGHSGLKPILDETGCFNGNAIRKVRITRDLTQAVYAELQAQIQQAKEMGLKISHFDSHHHIHTIPGLFPVLKRLQRWAHIRKVRATMNIYCRRVPASVGLRWQKALWNFALRHHYRTVTTEGFTSLQIFCEAAREQKLRHRSVELMVHPGGAGYEDETKMLMQDWPRQLPVTIDLVSYNDL